MLLYKLTNSVTDKSYIGITRRALKTRLAEHRRAAFKNNRTSVFCDALREFGSHSFECEVLGTAKNIENLLTMEALAIEVYETLVPAGYNQSAGGLGTPGRPHSEETRRKMSEKAKGRPAWNRGIPMSEEQKVKLSVAKTGVKTGQPAWNRGLHHDDEAKKKMSDAHSGLANWNVRPISIDGVSYPSIKTSVEQTGLSTMQVKYMLRNGKALYLTDRAGKSTGVPRQVRIDGIEYVSIEAASRATGLTRRMIHRSIQDEINSVL